MAFNVVKSVTSICVISMLARGLRSDMPVTREILSFAARSRERRRCTFLVMQIRLFGRSARIHDSSSH